MKTSVTTAYAAAFREYLPSKRVVVVALVASLIATLIVGGGYLVWAQSRNITVTAYFERTQGIYAGDRVTYLGIPIGEVDSITPENNRVRVRLHYDHSVKVPATAQVAVVSQSLVSARTMQLSPGYVGGETLHDGATIPQSRTAVPLEWDDLRGQLQRVAGAIEPRPGQPQGPLGNLVSSSARALAGRGDNVHDAIDELSAAMRTLSAGRGDLFASVRNLQVFVSALAASEQVIVQANNRFASVTDALTNTDGELADAVRRLAAVAPQIERFIADHRSGLASNVSKLATVTAELDAKREDIKQLLHVAPTALSNFYNIYQPAQGTLTGALAVTQFANPVQFICSAIEAAGQLGTERSAKLCAQYLGPVLKSMVFNHPPVGVNPVSGVQARPEQVDYSEPWLRQALGPTLAGAVTSKKTVTRSNGVPGLQGLPTRSEAPR